MDFCRLACLAVLGGALVLSSITDLRQRRIPNAVTWTALAACLAIRLLGHGLGALDGPGALSGLAAALLGGGLFYAVALGGGMGMGDVKLVAAVGAGVGIPLVFRCLVFIALAGALQALGALALPGLLRVLRGGTARPASERPSPSRVAIPYGLAIGAGVACAVASSL